MAGMWLNIALIAVILHHCYGMNIDCNNMFPMTPYTNVECHRNETTSRSTERRCRLDTANIKWLVTNTASGTLSAKFELIPQSSRCTYYELDLCIDENVANAEECGENISFPLLHSSRSLYILEYNTTEGRKVSSCGKTAVVTFNHVFTGCYWVDPTAQNCHSGYIDNKTWPMFIETEYKKDLLIYKKPRIIPQYIAALQELQFSVDYVARMELQIRKCDSLNCTCGNGIAQHLWEMALSPSGQFMCKVRDEMSDKPICHVVGDAIRCTIKNITTGFYCMLVDIVDERCKTNTVWNNESICLYNSKIIEVHPALPHHVGTLPPEPSLAASDAILLAVVLAFVIVCVCALVMIYRRWRRRRPSLDSGGSCYMEKGVPHRPQILLLYARDCEPFMNVMITFRQVLKEGMACEVYDCFDPDAAEELCQSKTDWLLNHISSPDVKVVLIESKCAVLQQMALVQHMKVIYKDPTWLDDLFLYGLRVLLEDLQTNVYKKVFVVRIHDFTEENDNLCHITPYIRYVVPQHTHQLLDCLYRESALEHVVIMDEDSLQRLQDNIRMLQVFKQKNGDYLNKLFETVMKECV